MALRIVDDKIRVYVLADDYRWHFVSDSFDEFASSLGAYVHLMSKSQKENTYSIKNIFLSQKEYEKARELIEGRTNPQHQITGPKKRAELQLV